MKITVKSNIAEIIDKYKAYQDTTELKHNVLEDMKKIGKHEISNSIGNSIYEDSEPLDIIDKDNAIGISGAQAIYDEYGTGTIGENNPHPEKDKCSIPLNAYNSGKTIRENSRTTSNATLNGIPLGGLYWTYKIQGKKIYTQGRAAGMHVYKAKMKIKQELKNIVKKRVGEFLSRH